MDRRQFLGCSLAGIGALTYNPLVSSCSAADYITDLGWIPGLKSGFTIPSVYQRSNLKHSGVGKVVLLNRFLERATGVEYVPHYQRIGDCVGQAYGLAVDLLTASQIHMLGRAEQFKAKTSTEAVYAGSRYEIGYLVHDNRRLLSGDGSLGEYAARFIRDYGILTRGKYGDVDISQYRPDIARQWGKTGVPDELEPQIRKHPVRTYSPVHSYEEARDAIANGYPIAVCSSVGFEINSMCRRCNPTRGRDEDGFLNPCGTWYHAMVFGGVDDSYHRPGLLCFNSHGDWVQGPTRHNQPKGTFWVDKHVVNRMLSEGDSFAISDYIGYPRRRIDYTLF